MTTYNSIAPTETDPEAPLTSSLLKRFAQNVLAMFEGAAGAPRLTGEGVARPGNGLAVLTVTAADTFTAQGGFVAVTGTLLTNSTADLAAQTWTISNYTGSMRFRASHTATGGTSTLGLFKNGTLVTSFGTTTGPVARVVDVAVVPGDVIEWRHHTTITNSSEVSNISVTASDAWRFQLPLIQATNI